MSADVLVEALSMAFQTAKRELNDLDGVAGDGDLGLTAGRAMDALLAVTPRLPGTDLAGALDMCGKEIARRAPSTAGTLAATALMAAGRAIREDARNAGGSKAIALALRAAADSVALRGRASAGDKTMLDALIPAADAAASAVERGASLDATLIAATEGARRGADATRVMNAVRGRAGWLTSRSSGHMDAGARAVVLVLETICTVRSQEPRGKS
jgi:dihydroxyacetone kinase-like protein